MNDEHSHLPDSIRAIRAIRGEMPWIEPQISGFSKLGADFGQDRGDLGLMHTGELTTEQTEYTEYFEHRERRVRRVLSPRISRMNTDEYPRPVVWIQSVQCSCTAQWAPAAVTPSLSLLGKACWRCHLRVVTLRP